jgi:ferric-dicitrate binding protein FerR (iron transport regulator)
MSTNDPLARVDTEIAAPLRETSPAVDELHRARLVSAIDGVLDREDADRDARRRAKAQRPRRRWPIIAAAAVVAAALVLVLRPHGGRAPAPGATVVVAPPASPPIVPPPSLLRPVQQPGRAAPAAKRAPELSPTTSLVALRGERARATIGARVRLTLVGAGRVSVLAAAHDGDIELALDGGRLLVEYDGHAGGTLRVRSPGAVTTVVGTVFAVEAMASGSRVAVTRGQVRTEDAAGRSTPVPAGISWTSADGRSLPIPDELANALAEHQAGWAAPRSASSERRGVSTPRERARRPIAGTGPNVDLDALYARAETAMRERSLGEARRALETIASRDPHGRLGETALLDLARLALADGDRAEARRALDRLPAALHDPALTETAAHLRCRAQRSGGDDGCDAAAAPPATR